MRDLEWWIGEPVVGWLTAAMTSERVLAVSWEVSV